MRLEVLKQLPDSDWGRPPLLFVHGGSHGAWCWQEHFLPYFRSSGFPSYALSLRGHGASSAIQDSRQCTLRNYVEDVLEVMASLNAKPVLIGHSMGGAIVQLLLQESPDAARGAVLMSSVPPKGMLRDAIRLAISNFRAARLVGMYNRGATLSPPTALFFSNRIANPQVRIYADRMRPESVAASAEMNRRIVSGRARLSVPLLVLGSRGDAIFSARSTIRTARYYAAEPVLLERLCHDMMLDPEWRTAADRIREFLNEILMQEAEGQ